MDITDPTLEPIDAPAEDLAKAPSRLSMILGPAAPWIITIAAGFLRFFRLSVPHKIIPLDETYYAREAVQYLQHGVEAAFAVHPPVGKWMIALGVQLFGDRPFGWRFTGALVGTLSVLLVYLIAKHLWRSRSAAVIASILIATDGLFFVQARIAMLDIFLAFFILLGFYLLLMDRERVSDEMRGLRWWRIGSGIAFGLAAATKWSAIPVIPVVILISYIWEVKRLKPRTLWQLRTILISGLVVLVPARLIAVTSGQLATLALQGALTLGGMLILVELGNIIVKRRPRKEPTPSVWANEIPVDVLPEPEPTEAFPSRSTRSAVGIVATYLLIPGLVYIGSYLPWFASTKRFVPPRCNTSVTVGNATTTTPYAGMKFWNCFQREIWDYHKNLKSTKVDGKPIHPYLSHAWSWPWIGRPVAHYFFQFHRGTETIDAEILGLPNPLSWWPAFLAIPLLMYFALRRDATAALILLMFVPLYLPWLITTRPLFMFYMTPAVPFLALGLTHVIHRSLQRWPGMTPFVAAYLVLVCLAFAFFYPILAAWAIPDGGVFGWSAKMWFGRGSFLWLKPDCTIERIRGFCWI